MKRPAPPPPEAAPAEAVDVVTLARFMVLPGAKALVDAFSAIPPGLLRESVVSHAQAIAATYAQAPASMQMPDPLSMAAAAPRPAAALEAPRKGPRLGGKDTEAVALRMQGHAPREIAAKLKMSLAEVQAAMKAAREAGATLPPLPKPDTKPVRFPISLDELDARGRPHALAAAKRLGVTPERYMELRALLVELRGRSTPIEDLVKALAPVPEKLIWQWIAGARAAGHKIPATLDFDEAEFTPAPAGVFRKLEAMTPQARNQTAQAAAARNLTAQAYLEVREHIVALRRSGVGPQEIAGRVGQDLHFVNNTLTAAQGLGVKFPWLRGAGPEPAAAPERAREVTG